MLVVKTLSNERNVGRGVHHYSHRPATFHTHYYRDPTTPRRGNSTTSIEKVTSDPMAAKVMSALGDYLISNDADRTIIRVHNEQL